MAIEMYVSVIVELMRFLLVTCMIAQGLALQLMERKEISESFLTIYPNTCIYTYTHTYSCDENKSSDGSCVDLIA